MGIIGEEPFRRKKWKKEDGGGEETFLVVTVKLVCNNRSCQDKHPE